jgi:hypothetical protein
MTMTSLFELKYDDKTIFPGNPDHPGRCRRCGLLLARRHETHHILARRRNADRDRNFLKQEKTMPISIKCSRCREIYHPTHRSKFGQVCPWCEDDIIKTERELSIKCGLRPLNELDIIELNKYWLYRNA